MKNNLMMNLIILLVLSALFITLLFPPKKIYVMGSPSPSPSERPSLLVKASNIKHASPTMSVQLPSLPFKGNPSPLSFPCEVNLKQLNEMSKNPVQQYIYQLMLGDMSNLDMVEPLLWCVYSPSYLANFKRYVQPLYPYVDDIRRKKLENIVNLSVEFLEYYTANGLTSPCQLKTLRVHMVEPIMEYNYQMSTQLQELL